MPGKEIAEGPVSKTNIGRLTNTIFVFAFFLLSRNIRTPTYDDWVAKVTAHQFGLMQLPEIVSFLNAFLILAMIWIVSFHIFHQYRWLDRKFLYLHFALLMFVIFIPITIQHATLFAQNPLASDLFHLNMLAIGLVIAFEWLHCLKTPALLSYGVPAGGLISTHASVLFIPLTALAGVVLVYCDLLFTQYIYFATMLAFIVADQRILERIRKFLEAKP
ncbi:MAG: TMEM175 family protein [Methanoregula sp.]